MIRALLLVMIGLVTFAAVYATMQPDAADDPYSNPPVRIADAAEAEAEPEADALPATSVFEEPLDELALDFSLRPGVDAESEAEIVVRDVTPENMTAGPQVTGPLERLEQVPEDAPPHVRAARMLRLFNPLVVSADTIRVRDREIALAGIDAPDFDARCGEGASAWPCGRMARAALRRFIRGRAIECEAPEGAEEIPDAARCEVAGEDIAAWLVAQGWARKTAQSYADAESAARNARLGLWGDARPDAQAEAVASSGCASSPLSAFAISARVSGMP